MLENLNLWLLFYTMATVAGFFLLEKKFFNLRPYVEPIMVDDLVAMVKDETVILVDVRTPREWETGTIKGSRLMSHDQLIHPNVDERVVCICNSGIRAQKAAENLYGMGLKNAAFLVGPLSKLQMKLDGEG
jgi:rhodanese-related sulfurtransferase